jgi:hypothetical protein
MRKVIRKPDYPIVETKRGKWRWNQRIVQGLPIQKNYKIG